MTPSISTFGVPLTVTTMITRMIGIVAPPARRNMVCSGERLLMVKTSSKAASFPVEIITFTLSSASSTTCGTGLAMAGPIISVRWIPFSMASGAASADAGRQRDAQLARDGLGELLGAHGAVRVAEPPEELRIAEVLRGDVVEPLSFRHHVDADFRQ